MYNPIRDPLSPELKQVNFNQVLFYTSTIVRMDKNVAVDISTH